jgi:hypothetical protein
MYATVQTLYNSTMQRGRDTCRSMRKTYDAILKVLTAWRWLPAILVGIPVVYIIGFLIYSSAMTSLLASFLSGTGYTIFGVLMIAWILVIISIWKTYPNLISMSVFIYKCIGHWSLVSFLILLFYGMHYGSAAHYYLVAFLLPPILLLLFCADILRAIRTRMFADLERPTSPENVTRPLETSVVIREI